MRYERAGLRKFVSSDVDCALKRRLLPKQAGMTLTFLICEMFFLCVLFRIRPFRCLNGQIKICARLPISGYFAECTGADFPDARRENDPLKIAVLKCVFANLNHAVRRDATGVARVNLQYIRGVRNSGFSRINLDIARLEQFPHAVFAGDRKRDGF